MSKVKLAYPKIPGPSKDMPFGRVYLFEKYDGTNLHWVWTRKNGWTGFGPRRARYDLNKLGIADFEKNHPGLEEAPGLFKDTLANGLETLFQTEPYAGFQEIVVFTEFLGPNSFAGAHKKEDPKELVLFDVQTDRGFLPPQQLADDFKEFNLAIILYEGKLTGAIVDKVRNGKFGVKEGVVAKAEKGGAMVKIKTLAYQEKLKEAFDKDWEDYWE